MTKKPSRAALNAAALAHRMGLHEWQVIRAWYEDLIPDRDRSKGWSADLAETIVPEAERIRGLVGTVYDRNAYEVADYLTRRKDDDAKVYVETVRELVRLGHLSMSRWIKTEICGRSLQAFIDRHDALDVVAAAEVTGRTLMADQAAERLQIRRADFDHITRAGLLKPISWKLTGYTSKRNDPGMSLYRQGDVDALAEQPSIGGIDWQLVRTVKPGQRSPLAKLPDTPATS